MSDMSNLNQLMFNVEPGEELADEVVEETEESKVYSVNELNRAIKDQLEGEFPMIWIKGEISNFKPHSSGHFYFSLKDDKAQISAVMFKGFNRHVKFKPADGMEVLVRGKVTVYEPRGSYQIMCEVMEPVGAGALQIAFEQLKAKLQKEGLFDQARKRKIPEHSQRVAIVTSPTGAAIRDMLNVLGRRMKNLEVTIFPCAVQGIQAQKEIVAAIQIANKIGNFDVMIVGRGGGSIEDLWAFNEEAVVRAIAASVIPTVSAVGHEVDFTIADFVADLRAPTPSAAAELISRNAADLMGGISMQFKALRNSMNKKIQMEKQKLFHAQRQLVDPKRKLQDLMLKLDDLSGRAQNAIQKNITFKRQLFIRWASVLDSLSPLKVLDRGYAIVKNDKDNIIKDVKKLKKGDEISIQLFKGEVVAEVKSTK
ncbi:MAG: exodeoxyribonuclease VII large subunit [Bdellovibrionota bacterium]